MTRRPSAARMAAAVLLPLLLAVGLAPAKPAAAEPPTLDEIYRQLGVDDVSASYVVLIDTSLSMKAGNLYAEVRNSLRQFFAALAPGDTLTLVSMAEDARVIWEGAVGTSPDDIAAKLPPEPTGTYTDLGAGIAAAVNALEARRDQPIASVVLLTDGQHDPPPGSAFPFTEGFAWQQLAQRAVRLEQLVTPLAIQLRGVNGATALKRVFPSAQVVKPHAIDQLTARLAEPKETVKAAKARSILGDDLRSSVVVEWPATLDSPSATVRLRSTSRHLPVEVSDLVVHTDSAGVQVTVPPGPFILAPGASTAVVLTIAWDARPMSWRPIETVRRPYQLRLSGKVGSPWAPVLAAQVGVTAEPSLAGTDVSGTVLEQRGSSTWWLATAGLLVALLLLGMRLRWVRLHPVPSGTLVATPLDDTQSGGSIPLRSRRVAILASSLGISGTGSVSGRRRGIRSEQVLSIAYSKDGTGTGRAVGDCPAGGSVDMQGVRFEWRR
ncbi:MAG TPA: vWA domain-containing protein [Micromonosporaceae bacterium]|nr:vWA domain-containing protein [Micromonosporaceae bacterium]